MMLELRDEAARGRLRQLRIVPVRNDGYLAHQFPEGVGQAVGQLKRIPQGRSDECVHLAGSEGGRKILDDLIGKGVSEHRMTDEIVRQSGIDGPRRLVPGSVAGRNPHTGVDLTLSPFQPKRIPPRWGGEKFLGGKGLPGPVHPVLWRIDRAPRKPLGLRSSDEGRWDTSRKSAV